MRASRFCFQMGLTALFAVPALLAQGTAQSTIVSYSTAGFIAATGGGLTGEPYTANRKTTRVQTLANGTTISHETTVKEARDSNGKTYRESRPELSANAAETDFVMVHITDPANRVMINWNSRSKQASIIHMPEPNQIRPVPTMAQAPQVEAPIRQLGNNQVEPQIERLGSKMINGVNAEGTRITRIIPAGKQGNDQPIIVVREAWRSPDLHIVVQEMDNDPRSGVTTVELTDLEQGEPNPALFQIPEGYTVSEHFPGENQ